MTIATASTFLKVVLIMVLIGFVIEVIGFATPYWVSYSRNYRRNHYSAHSGLWKACVDGYDHYRGFSVEKCGKASGQGWFEATQAFETIGFIAAIVALVLIVLYVFVPQTSGKKIVFILAMLACFAAAGSIILGIIIYGSKMDNLSWSFALCCIAGIIFGISGVLLIVDMLKR